jgi:hypothetical protein
MGRTKRAARPFFVDYKYYTMGRPSLDTKYFQGNQDMISSDAWVIGGSRGMVGDILSQLGERVFLVKTDEGTSRCKLVDKLSGPGQMTITATHVNHGKFNVIKITDDFVWKSTGERYRWVVGAKNAHDDVVGIVSP